MSLSATKLSDLPLHLQVRILTFLSPPTLRSIKPSLQTVKDLFGMIPNHLLDVANTSRDLRKAVNEVLAARAQILNGTTVWPMWDWIPVLSDSIKAVSLHATHKFSTPFERYHGIGRELRSCVTFSKIFRALSVTHIRLQVLDVTSVPFHQFSGVDGSAELFCSFKSALETSASSLRELAIRVTPICIEAVSQVALPSLQVVLLRKSYKAIETREKSPESHSYDKPQSECEFMHAMLALEGHADRAANKTTLRELHFLYLDNPPCIHNENTCNGLLEAVQVLKLGAREEKADEFAKFVALFPNLRSLLWLGLGMVRNLPKLLVSCPLLEELQPSHHPHISLSDWIKSSSPDSHTFRDACLTYRGKLRWFYVHSPLTTDQLRILGESCPGLESFRMHLNRENLGGLSCLLSESCRSLKLLDIYLCRKDVNNGNDGHESYGTLGTDGWRALSQAIRGASSQLRDLSFTNNLNDEPNYRDMVQFALDVIEFLGDRAINFCLDSIISTDSLETVHELLCAIINKCVIHSRKLERLLVRLVPDWCSFQNRESESFWCAELLHDMKRLEELPYLYQIDVGRRDVIGRDPLR